MKKWFGTSDDDSTPIAEVDLRAGGQYRIGMRRAGKETPSIVGGTYREVRVPEHQYFSSS